MKLLCRVQESFMIPSSSYVESYFQFLSYFNLLTTRNSIPSPLFKCLADVRLSALKTFKRGFS